MRRVITSLILAFERARSGRYKSTHYRQGLKDGLRIALAIVGDPDWLDDVRDEDKRGVGAIMRESRAFDCEEK